MKKIYTYSHYKKSDVVWLREVPNHWKIIKAKRIFIETSIKGFPDEVLLAATQNKGVIPKSHYGKTTVTATKNFETLKLVEKGDFVISLRSFQGGIEYAHFKGIISPAYTILKPQEEVVHKYYRYILKSKRYISGLTLLVTGIREGQNIDTSKFKDSYLPLPPKSEQTTIAKFLDYKLEKIDRFIFKKKQLIDLLDEQKNAIINQAVTKGLDKNVPMKPSGIEWFGDIPAHWEVKKLKYIGKCQNGISAGAEYFGSGFPFITYGDVYNQCSLPLTGSGLAKSSEADRVNYSVIKGDIFFTRTSETIEEIGFASTCLKTIENATFSGFVIRVRPNPNILFDNFSKFYFRSSLHRRFFVKEMNLVTRASLSQVLLKKLPILIPPIKEQKSISLYIDKETQKINKTITTIKKEITLVEEYKTALIAEAVTGKIDVRNFQVPTTNPAVATAAVS